MIEKSSFWVFINFCIHNFTSVESYFILSMAYWHFCKGGWCEGISHIIRIFIIWVQFLVVYKPWENEAQFELREPFFLEDDIVSPSAGDTLMRLEVLCINETWNGLASKMREWNWTSVMIILWWGIKNDECFMK